MLFPKQNLSLWISRSLTSAQRRWVWKAAGSSETVSRRFLEKVCRHSQLLAQFSKSQFVYEEWSWREEGEEGKWMDFGWRKVLRSSTWTFPLVSAIFEELTKCRDGHCRRKEPKKCRDEWRRRCRQEASFPALASLGRRGNLPVAMGRKNFRTKWIIKIALTLTIFLSFIFWILDRGRRKLLLFCRKILLSTDRMKI